MWLDNATRDTIMNSKIFYLMNRFNEYVELDNDCNELSSSFDTYGKNYYYKTIDMACRKKPDTYGKYIKVEIFPRKIGEINNNLDFCIVKNTKDYKIKYDFYCNIQKTFLIKLKIYDEVINMIKNYRNGNWDWFLQSVSVNKLFELE